MRGVRIYIQGQPIATLLIGQGSCPAYGRLFHEFVLLIVNSNGLNMKCTISFVFKFVMVAGLRLPLVSGAVIRLTPYRLLKRSCSERSLPRSTRITSLAG